MATNVRRQRVADRIRAELSDLIRREMADPRLELVTVTDVTVDRELAFANVFVSSAVAGGAASAEERQREIMAALHGATGYLRREIGARVRLRTTPQLLFHWDPTPDRGAHLAEILDSLQTSATDTPEESEPSEERTLDSN
jgi:ribosome-binding factor A